MKIFWYPTKNTTNPTNTKKIVCSQKALAATKGFHELIHEKGEESSTHLYLMFLAVSTNNLMLYMHITPKLTRIIGPNWKRRLIN